MSRHAVNGSFAILYFIQSSADPEPSTSLFNIDHNPYETNPTLAGFTYVFASPKEGCPNCGSQAEADVKVRNSTSITSQLMDYVVTRQLQSLAPEHVEPFLSKRLRWRIIDVSIQSP